MGRTEFFSFLHCTSYNSAFEEDSNLCSLIKITDHYQVSLMKERLCPIYKTEMDNLKSALGLSIEPMLERWFLTHLKLWISALLVLLHSLPASLWKSQSRELSLTLIIDRFEDTRKDCGGYVCTHHGLSGRHLLEFAAGIYGPTCLLSCICNTLLSSPHTHGIHSLRLALQRASSLTLRQFSSFFHNSEDPSTSTPALVSCPVLNLLSILPLCHYMSLLLVSNRAASIISIDFYV